MAPSAMDYVERACRATGRRTVNRGASWFIARVVDSTGKPAAGVVWHAWSRSRNPRTGDASGGGDWKPIDDAGGTTSSDGLLQYCGGALLGTDYVLIEARMSKKGFPLFATIELTRPITAVRLKLMPEAINLPHPERDEPESGLELNTKRAARSLHLHLHLTTKPHN